MGYSPLKWPARSWCPKLPLPNGWCAPGVGEGPAAGLALLEGLDLDDYYLFHAARADLLRRLDQLDAAAAAYRRARILCSNAVDGRYLDRRLAEVTADPY